MQQGVIETCLVYAIVQLWHPLSHLANKLSLKAALVIVAFGAWLPSSSLLAGAMGFVPLPLLYWPLLAAILGCYMVLTQLIKTWFIRRYAID